MTSGNLVLIVEQSLQPRRLHYGVSEFSERGRIVRGRCQSILVRAARLRCPNLAGLQQVDTVDCPQIALSRDLPVDAVRSKGRIGHDRRLYQRAAVTLPLRDLRSECLFK